MLQKLLTPRILSALAKAGKRAFAFAPIFLIFLVATIFMVGGDGSAPGVTHLSAAIVGFTVKLLGVPFGGAVIPVVLFWSLAVFTAVFLYAVLPLKRSPPPDNATIDRQTRYWAVGSLIAFLAATYSLIRSHHDENAAIDEKRLALEFVQNNAAVMQEVGGSGKVDLVSQRISSNAPPLYDISVRGSKTIYAIVESSNGSRPPTFTLVCTTPLYIGQRDPFKHPCKQ